MNSCRLHCNLQLYLLFWICTHLSKDQHAYGLVPGVFIKYFDL